MAIFKSKESTYQKSEIEGNTENYDQYESEEVIEATETEEEEQSHEAEETETIPTEVVRSTTFTRAKHAPAASSTAMTRQPAAAASKKKVSDNRGCLTTKIDRALHSRLKIHSYKVNKSIASVLEELIAQHIPEIKV